MKNFIGIFDNEIELLDFCIERHIDIEHANKKHV